MRLRNLLALLLTLSAALALPAASANPCASGCGQIQTVLNCFTVTVTAQGESSFTATEWRFEVHERWNYGYGRTHVDTDSGPAVTFQYTNTVPSHFIYRVDSYLYADGQLVAEDHWACVA